MNNCKDMSLNDINCYYCCCFNVSKNAKKKNTRIHYTLWQQQINLLREHKEEAVINEGNIAVKNKKKKTKTSTFVLQHKITLKPHIYTNFGNTTPHDVVFIQKREKREKKETTTSTHRFG